MYLRESRRCWRRLNKRNLAAIVTKRRRRSTWTGTGAGTVATSVGGGGREDATRVDSVRGGLGGTACDTEAEALPNH